MIPRIGSHVCHAVVEGRTVLLDFLSQAYYVLDPVASAMWQALAQTRHREQSLRALEARFAVGREQLESDFDRFIRKCQDANFLSETPSIALPGPSRPPYGGKCFLTVRAWLQLYRAANLLKTRGFSDAYRWLVSPTGGKSSPSHDDALLTRAVAAFACAENFFPLRNAPHDCLPRSLALFRFLQSTGLNVCHRIGVRLYPFTAHAWVECGGQVVHDDPSNAQRYTVIASAVA